MSDYYDIDYFEIYYGVGGEDSLPRHTDDNRCTGLPDNDRSDNDSDNDGWHKQAAAPTTKACFTARGS